MTITVIMKLHRCAVLGALAAGLVLVGCAGTPRSTVNNAAPSAELNSDCVLDNTASRIPRTGPECSASGRSYSSEDILRTGATNAGRALQLLDPSITLNH